MFSFITRLIPAPWLILGVIAVAAAALTGTYFKGRSDGREAVLIQLQEDRITVLKDGQEIDNEVLGADDDALCNLLGGCGLPDEPVGD